MASSYTLNVFRTALVRESKVVGGRRDNVTSARDTLRAAFDRDRRALGDDEYGAELEKKMPGIEAGIFNALQAYIDDLDGLATGLRVSAARYEQAEHPNR
ncbi:hypothetical protein [Streptosporangium sp. KLBMP 9127]|nr:hypothetical protein [Streptosporangium sp. KLBMP 9127]